MVNIHLATHTNLKNASRIQKITRSLSETELFDEIIIIGVADQDLPDKEDWGHNRTVYRVSLPNILQTLRKKLTKTPSDLSQTPKDYQVSSLCAPLCLREKPSSSYVSLRTNVKTRLLPLILLLLDNIYQYLLAPSGKKNLPPLQTRHH
jgi:hypothetical protein